MTWSPGFALSFGDTIKYGPIARYSINGEKKTKYTGTTAAASYDSTTTGGNTLGLGFFAELSSISFKPSFTLGYTMIEKSQSKRSNSTTENENEVFTSATANLEFHFFVTESNKGKLAI